MTFRYYLNDIYEWTTEAKKRDIGNIFHAFHEVGYAQEYLMDGYIEMTISWKEGA